MDGSKLAKDILFYLFIIIIIIIKQQGEQFFKYNILPVWPVEKLCMLCMPAVAMVMYICMLVARLSSRVVSNLFLDTEHQLYYWQLDSTLQPVEVP